MSPGEVPFLWWDGVCGAARGWRELWAGHRGGSEDKRVPLGTLCFEKNPPTKRLGWMGQQQQLQKSHWHYPPVLLIQRRDPSVDHPKALPLMPA